MLVRDLDDALLIKKLTMRSKQLDVRLTTCVWPEEAFIALLRQPFDVVYADLWLGFETSAAFVCECARRNDAPVIVLTACDDPAVRRLAFRAGARAYLAKEELSTQALDAVTLAVLRDRNVAPPPCP